MNSALGLGAFPRRRTLGVLTASLLTFSVNAAPMMIPTAMSTTLPLTAKALNSLSTPIVISLLQMSLVLAV